MRLLYSLLFYAFIPFLLVRQLWRARHNRAHIARLAERFGYVAPITGTNKRVWVHTVSVGEFIGALPLIRALLARNELEIIVTTTTITGSERVQAALGGRVHHYYMPYDLPSTQRRFLKTVAPDLLIIMETELWPNTLAGCNAMGVPSLLVNARLSERSARGYARVSQLTRVMLERLGAAGIQQTADAERFYGLGLAPTKATVTGNIKFDITLDDQQRQLAHELRRQWNPDGLRRIWVVASTHQGEDEIILAALKKLRAAGIGSQELLLVLVPRHPERFAQVGAQAINEGFTLARRSTEESPTHATDILLGDTMGELPLFYGAADIVFMGGSLVDVGGHNFIEAAAWGRPLLSGPHLRNFAEVARLLNEAGALQITPDAAALSTALQQLLNNTEQAQQAGQAALSVAEQNRGALARTLALVERML